jgi:hypothetical protein
MVLLLELLIIGAVSTNVCRYRQLEYFWQALVSELTGLRIELSPKKDQIVDVM